MNKEPRVASFKRIVHFSWGLLALGLMCAPVGTAGTEVYDYDELGRLKKVTHPNGAVTNYTLDAAGNRQSTSTGGSPPTYIAITNYDGTILPSAASLYVVENSCQQQGPWATVCTWIVRKLYGDHTPVVVVALAPNGSIPACYSGTTQTITNGYVRSACSLTALSTVYGN